MAYSVYRYLQRVENLYQTPGKIPRTVVSRILRQEDTDLDEPDVTLRFILDFKLDFVVPIILISVTNAYDCNLFRGR
jgi:hypothetical protein